jgi:DNA adenine methylase
MMILKYQGSKYRFIDRYFKYIPNHKLYVEPFLGSGTMFLNKDLAHYSLLNDIDYLIYNFFKCLNSDKEKFIFKLRNTYYTQEILNEFVDDLKNYNKKNEPDYDLAVKLFIVLRKTWRGAVDKGIGFKNILATNRVLSNDDFFNDIREITEKFRKSIIYNLHFKDFSVIVDKFLKTMNVNNDDVFCFLDPPYIGKTGYRYNKFTQSDYYEMYQLFSKYKIMICGFDDEFTNEFCEKHNLRKEIIIERHSFSKKVTEIVLLNY